MAVNQKPISARIDNILLEELDAWCRAHKIKRNSAINMGIKSLLYHGTTE